MGDAVDYRILLKKFIEWVRFNEGTTLLGNVNETWGGFTAEEVVALREIDYEVEFDRTH